MKAATLDFVGFYSKQFTLQLVSLSILEHFSYLFVLIKQTVKRHPTILNKRLSNCILDYLIFW